jgi:hypothetical protein
MTKRFNPLVIIRSAVDFRVSGENCQALRWTVRDSAATRFCP